MAQHKLIHKITRGAILVCQSLFLSIVLTAGLYLIGLSENRMALPLLGGIFLFSTTLLYFRTLVETDAHRPLTKLVLVMLSAFVGGAGIAITLNILKNDVTSALEPLPILLLIPFFFAVLEAADRSRRTE